ncbi:MAG: hypothetical protein COB67_10880 [SAR324 cluster bacterium]|uniref:DNA translocase FtsK 4TM region domain-containing protein n=1 Tax=SAR324 cluster bacterium TaxID=2024889 RepID=A0A2A4SV61_9DELT|nr:MAG: hypothetical protein COB67_10880 [SAR324 cluster bacterium]
MIFQLNSSIENNSLLKLWAPIKVLFGCIIFTTIVTQGWSDPSPENLLYSTEGIQNWLGLPGALVGGGLLMLWGWSAVALPLYWVFLSHQRKSPCGITFMVHLLAMMMFNLFVSLLFPQDHPSLYQATGLFGVMANQTLLEFPGRWLSLAIVAVYLTRFARRQRFSDTFPQLLLKLALYTFAFFKISCIYIFDSFQRLVRELQKQGLFSPINASFPGWQLFGQLREQWRNQSSLKESPLGQGALVTYHQSSNEKGKQQDQKSGNDHNVNQVSNQEVQAKLLLQRALEEYESHPHSQSEGM